MIVRDFNSRKACDYLDTGQYHRVLIIFHHGLGDSVMFYSTCLKALKARYPDIEFAYDTHLGQESIFGHVDNNPDHYDIAFNLGYPCSEWGNINETKSEKCARTELGLPLPLKEEYDLPKSFPSPLVGVHFNSTCCANLNVGREFGRRLWEQIQDAGFIPIDTHMRHVNDHAEKSIVHDYEQCRKVDNIPATVDKLVGLLSHLRGFAGVPSGNVACAMAVLPPRKILYLSSEFPKDRLVHLDVFEMSIRKPYDPKIVGEWLEELRRG